MANIKSSKKRARTAKVRTARNKSRKATIKTSIRNFNTAIEANNIEEARTAFVKTERQLDRAVTKGIIHKNTAARKKSRLAKILNDAI